MTTRPPALRSVKTARWALDFLALEIAKPHLHPDTVDTATHNLAFARELLEDAARAESYLRPTLLAAVTTAVRGAYAALEADRPGRPLIEFLPDAARATAVQA